MSLLNIHLPDSLRKQIEEIAAAEGITIDQFLARAAGEKLAAVRGMEALRRDAATGRREDFDRVMDSVPDVPPNEGDQLDG